jgi:single-stranded DNA-binding protein
MTVGRDGVRDRTRVEIECWGQLGATVARYRRDGRLVSVIGRLPRAAWAGHAPGERRHESVFVTATAVEVLDRSATTKTT